MRERSSVKIDRCTGERTETAELLPDAPFAERIASMKASGMLAILGGGPVEEAFLHLKCDGCGRKAVLDYEHPEMPSGWVERDDGDFCPTCRGKR